MWWNLRLPTWRVPLEEAPLFCLLTRGRLPGQHFRKKPDMRSLTQSPFVCLKTRLGSAELVPRTGLGSGSITSPICSSHSSCRLALRSQGHKRFVSRGEAVAKSERTKVVPAMLWWGWGWRTVDCHFPSCALFRNTLALLTGHSLFYYLWQSNL